MNRAIDEGIYDELIDPRLENNLNSTEMARMIASAAACIRHSARKRPKMSQVQLKKLINYYILNKNYNYN